MSSRRTIILVIALAMSAVSAFGIFSYVQGVEDAANAEEILGTYWVVNEEIPKGTSMEEVQELGMLVQVDVAIELVPDTAVGDPFAELNGQVAVTNLARNVPIVEGLFLSSNVVETGISQRLSDGNMVTVTLGLDQIRAVAFQIEPGDHVNILALKGLEPLEDPTQADLPPSERTDIAFGTNRDGIAPFDNDPRYLYQNAEVLAVGKTLTAQLGDEEPEDGAAVLASGLITLAVPPEAVQIILGIEAGNIYLSLVPPSYVPHPLAPIDVGRDLLPGEMPEELTPYGPDGRTEDDVTAP